MCYKKDILLRHNRSAELLVFAFSFSSILAILAILFAFAPHAGAQQFTFQRFDQDEGLKNHDVFKLIQDKTGYLWAATENGLFRYDGAEFRRFGTADGIHESLVIDLYQDDSGRIWTSTNDHLSGSRFEALPFTPGAQFTPGQHLTSIDSRHILFLNKGALMLAQPAGTSQSWTISPYFDAQQIAANPELSQLHNVFVDHDNSLWLGCAQKLCHVNGSQVEVLGEQQGIPAEPWRIVFRDRHNALWIRDNQHILTLTPGSSTFIDRSISPDILGTFGGSGILTIAEDRNGRVLTQTSTGIARWSGDHWQLFDHTNGLDFSDISTILSDQNGALWFSSRGHGLRRWLGYDEVENWTVSQGLGNDIVWTIFRDHKKQLWLGDEVQVSQLDEAQNRILPSKDLPPAPFQKTDGITQSPDGSLWIVNIYGQLLHSNPITQRDGLISNDTNEAAFLADTDGSVWIGVNGGAIHLLHPERLFSHPPLKVMIESATLGTRSLNLSANKDVWRWRNVPLDISFTSLNYDRQGSTIFRYRLLGLEPTWNQTASHHLHYAAMPPGSFRFEVEAIDADQQQHSTIASFDVSIRPPWWRTHTFYLCLAILSFLCSLLLWHLRERRLIKRQQHLEKLVAQRTSELEAEKIELLTAREALHHQATHDALTGLFNRSAILDTLQREFDHARREGTPLAVVLADIDYFKKINDTLGHLAGDLILRDAAHRMAQNIRPTDFIGRYGGEEFLIVLPGLPEGDPPARLNQLQNSLSDAPFLYLTESIHVTSSFGAAWIDSETISVEDMSATLTKLSMPPKPPAAIASSFTRSRHSQMLSSTRRNGIL